MPRIVRDCLAAIAVSGTALVVGAIAPAVAQDPIELKLAHYLPTANGMHKDFLDPWARELEACSGGEVKVTIYPAGTQLGNIARRYEEVSTGVVDIAHGVAGVPLGRFERTRLMELPFVVPSANAAAKMLWAMHDKLAPEWPGVKLLALHSPNPGQIHMKTRPVRTAADLAGLRIRFPTEATRDMLVALGAEPVGLPAGAVYEALEKNAVDGTVFTWDTMQSFKLIDVTNYHLDARAYGVVLWFAMNGKRYDSLPEKTRACIDESTGAALADRFGPWWAEWDRRGRWSPSGTRRSSSSARPSGRSGRRSSSR